MRAGLCLVGILAMAGFAVPPVARADIYRWVDEKGVINYSNKRPDGVKKVERFEETLVDTAPAIPKEELARQRELALAARVERLERELYEARRADAMAAAAPAYDPYYSGYAPYPGYAAYGYPVYGYPVYGYPIVGVRSAPFRRFPVGGRPIVRPVPVHGTMPVQPHGVRPARMGR
jgi:murein DD-endopeptidase MepM/ murein hydrolase activator NlpD